MQPITWPSAAWGNNNSNNRFRYLVYFRPESLLEHLLRLAQSLDASKHVQVSQHSHHLWKPMGLQDVEKLKGIHLKTMVTIHQQQYLWATMNAQIGQEWAGGPPLTRSAIFATSIIMLMSLLHSRIVSLLFLPASNTYTTQHLKSSPSPIQTPIRQYWLPLSMVGGANSIPGPTTKVQYTVRVQD